MKQPTTTSKKYSLLERTAYHEAGHAVAHHHNQLGLQLISIVRTRNSLGNCSGSIKRLVTTIAKLEEGSNDLKTRVYVERQIQVFLAGLTSEWLLTGRRTWRHFQQDLDSAENLARSLEGSGEATSALLTLLRIRTEAFLKNHWHEVEALGVALLERKTLTGKQGRQIIRELPQNSLSQDVLRQV